MTLATVVYWLATQGLMSNNQDAIAAAEFDEVKLWKERV